MSITTQKTTRKKRTRKQGFRERMRTNSKIINARRSKGRKVLAPSNYD